jgi:hypothetical protein
MRTTSRKVRKTDLIDPITLGNMRHNGVRSLAVSYSLCHDQAVIDAARGRGWLMLGWVARRRVVKGIKPYQNLSTRFGRQARLCPQN